MYLYTDNGDKFRDGLMDGCVTLTGYAGSGEISGVGCTALHFICFSG